MNFKETPFGKIPETWGVDNILNVTSIVTDYVANGSFASLAENVKYKDEEDVAVLIRLVDYNAEFKGPFVFIDEHAYNFLGKSKLYGDEIIISNVGAIGTVFRCPKLKYKMSLGPNSIMVKFKENDDFYYYWLKSKYGQHMLQSIVTGSAQPKFNKTNFREMVVPVPPTNIKNKIVKILKSIDNKIENNNKIIRNLEDLSMTLFKEFFIDNSEKIAWNDGLFIDLIDNTLGGDWGKESPSGNNTKMVYCVRGADIPEVKKGRKGKMPFRYILPKNFDKKRLKDGDLVVEISGGSPTQSTGRVCVISNALLNRYGHGMVCTNFCRAITPKAGYTMFVYHYWQYLYDIGLFFNYENGTTGIKNFDLTGFTTRHQIKIPPIELINKFTELCNVNFLQICHCGLENDRLIEIRDSLLNRLMTGEVDLEDIDL